jgi:hypothetical protein
VMNTQETVKNVNLQELMLLNVFCPEGRYEGADKECH